RRLPSDVYPPRRTWVRAQRDRAHSGLLDRQLKIATAQGTQALARDSREDGTAPQNCRLIGPARSRSEEKLGSADERRDLDHGVGLLPHRTDEQLHDAAVELCVGAALQLGKCVLGGASLFVGAIASDGVVRIRDRNDPRTQWNLLPSQRVGIT